MEGECDVESGLAAKCGQDGVGAFGGDDPFDELGGNRLDIGAVGHVGVGHDRGRVGVDQDDAIPFLAERLAGLGAGVVELASLADDDGAGADDQDRLEVSSLGHDVVLGSFESFRRLGLTCRRALGPHTPRSRRSERGPLKNPAILARNRGRGQAHHRSQRPPPPKVHRFQSKVILETRMSEP